jgi:hypothetical protein
MAKAIQDKYTALGGDAQHFEADEFHMGLSEKGDWCYQWRQELLEYAHDYCRGRAAFALKNQLYSQSVVIVSNTTLTCNETSTWLRMAHKNNLRNEDVHIVHCLSNFGSVHDVPEEKIEFMRSRMQSNEEIKELLTHTPYKIYTNYYTSTNYDF